MTMQLVYADRVKETSTTTGTGTYTLAGAVTGFQSFVAIGDAKQCLYAAEDGTNWEVGIGTYTAAGTLLARTTILASSNANAAVNWAAGSRNIFCTDSAARVAAFGFNAGGLVTAPVTTGARSIAVGSASSATGADGIAIGTGTLAQAANAIAMGSGNAQYADSVAIGGAWARAASSVAIGDSAQPQGVGSVMIGGSQFYSSGTVQGKDAASVGGSYSEAITDCSTVFGFAAKTRFFGAVAHGGGGIASTAVWGAAQTERVIRLATTTDATTTALTCDSHATVDYLTFPANFDCAVIVHVVGRAAATGDSIAFRLEGLLHSNGTSVPSLVGSVPTPVNLGNSAGAAAWTAALAVDAVTHNCLLVNVTGAAATTIKWVARIEFVEVGA